MKSIRELYRHKDFCLQGLGDNFYKQNDANIDRDI